MRRHFGFVVLTCLFLQACGSTPEPKVAGPSTVEAMDWVDLDGQLPRRALYGNNRWFGDFDADPAGQYRRATLFDAPWDSLDAEALAARSDAEHRWRRQEAEALVRKAFIAISDRGSRMSHDVLAQRSSVGSLYLLDRVMKRALASLHTAVGTDPTYAAAWYHLAYFSAVVGDGETASLARTHFLALAPPPDPRRVRLILDEGWHLRDSGRYELAAIWLEGHEAEFEPGPVSKHQIASRAEADLIRALCFAEQGDGNNARRMLAQLPPVRVRDGYGWRESDILRDWVNAWAKLRAGEPELAAFHFQYRPTVRLPASIAKRVWQDFGLLHEEMDRLESAARFWGVAYLTQPYLGFYPMTALHGTDNVLDQPDTGEPYIIAFRRFFLGGSFWGFTATRALACQYRDEHEDPPLWHQTFACLDACIRRQIHEPQSRVLRARLNLQRGDWQAAEKDLRHAAIDRIMGSAGEADVAFLQGVALLNGNQLAASIEPLRRCVELEPGNVRGWQALAVTYSYLGLDDEALAAYDHAGRLRPLDGVNYFNRGLFNLQNGRRDAAEADLVQAVHLLDDNRKAIEILQAVASGRDVTVDLAPQPVQLVTTEKERTFASDLDRLLDAEGASPEFQELLEETAEERVRWLAMFERRYREDPAAAQRARLAEARARAGDQRAVVSLLEPDWPSGLTPLECALLLDADRNLGLVDRAAAIAANAVPDTAIDVPVLVRTMVILLDHGRTDQARAVFERATALAPDEPALRELESRLP